MRGARRIALASLLLLWAAPACSTEDDRPATFSYVYAAIVAPSCTTVGCHSELVATYGLQLDTLEDAYAALTGRDCDDPPPDPDAGATGYVTPGEPDRSALVQRLRGDDVALRMPPDRPLPEVDIELVERWILEGARCD